MSKSNFKKLKLASASLIAVALAGHAAYAQPAEFEIESQPLSTALLEFNEQSGVMVVAPQELLNGKTAPAISGSMEPSQALEQLLAESGLEFTSTSKGAFTIAPVSAEEEEVEPRPFRVAEVDQESSERTDAISSIEDEQLKQDTITVTGSNIRGQGFGASPGVSFDKAEIKLRGFPTTQQFLAELPQNFNGEIGEAQAFTAANSGLNFSQGAGLNLRGLGGGATLVLLNGQRVAPTADGLFVDVAMIPISAIARIEVLTDGASAIYGSDAIAGVVNFVTDKDFDGMETSLLYGASSDGAAEELRIGNTVGTKWGSGNLIGVYEYYSREALMASDRPRLTNEPDPYALLPDQEAHSLLLSAEQGIGNAAVLSASMLFSDRSTEASNVFIGVGTLRSESDAQQLTANIGLDVDLSDTASVSVNASHSRNDLDVGQFVDGVSFPSPNSLYEVSSFDVVFNGEFGRVPAGEVRYALGGAIRGERFETKEFGRKSSRDISALFGEVNFPIVSDVNRFPGAEELLLTAAVRYEDYSDFGDSIDPKFGLVWRPIKDLKVRSTFGTSFRAPQLSQIDSTWSALAATFPDPLSPGDNVVALWSQGRNPALEAETAENFTVGFDYAPEFIDGFNLSASYVEIEYSDRIQTPSSLLIDMLSGGIFNDFVIRNPTAEEVVFAIGNEANLLNFTGLSTEDLINNVQFVGDNRLQNTAATTLESLDWQLSYQHSLQSGLMSYGFSGSYIVDAQRKLTPNAPSVDDYGVIFKPADLRLTGSVSYAAEGFTVSGFLRHVGEYDDDRELPTREVESWTTLDLGVSVYPEEVLNSPLLKGTEIGLNLQNVTNEDPPFIQSGIPGQPGGVFYDGANANPLGRYFSVNIRKRW